jgi:hypothetical protein
VCGELGIEACEAEKGVGDYKSLDDNALHRILLAEERFARLDNVE